MKQTKHIKINKKRNWRKLNKIKRKEYGKKKKYHRWYPVKESSLREDVSSGERTSEHIWIPQFVQRGLLATAANRVDCILKLWQFEADSIGHFHSWSILLFALRFVFQVCSSVAISINSLLCFLSKLSTHFFICLFIYLFICLFIPFAALF